MTLQLRAGCRLPATVSTIAASTTSQHFSLRFYARGLVHAPQAVGIEIKVITGTRSYAEQDALYAKGRTSPDADKVTNAKGGHSNLYFFVASNRWIGPLAQGISRSPIRNKFPRDIRPI